MVRPQVEPTPGGRTDPRLEPEAYGWSLNLLQSFSGLLDLGARLASRLSTSEDDETLTGGTRLNLYLVICALDQVLADYLHRHFYDFSRIVSSNRSAARVAETGTRALHRMRSWWAGALHRELLAVERDLLGLAVELAGGLPALGPPATPSRVTSGSMARAVARMLQRSYPAALLMSRAKVPASFRGVDLYPEDGVALARLAHADERARAGPPLVIGLRTAGLYLAPICAAALGRLLQRPPAILTLRPGVPLLGEEARTVREVAQAGGWALVVDDPSWWGGALAKSGAMLISLGMPASRICYGACEIGNQPVFRLAEDAAYEPEPQERQRIWAGFGDAWKAILRAETWHVQHLLADRHVEQVLNQSWALARLRSEKATVLASHPLDRAGAPPGTARPATGNPSEKDDNAGLGHRQRRRFHAKRLFDVQLDTRGGGRRSLVLAKGAGLGFFGYHSLLIANRLAGYVPTVIGLDHGILYSEWMPAEPLQRQSSAPSRIIRTMGEYVATRAASLRLPERGMMQFGGSAAYFGARRAGRVLCRGLGRLGALGQFRAGELIASSLSEYQVAVVDGQLRPCEWLVTFDGGRLLKSDYEEHGFDINDRSISDPAYDLAGISAEFGFDEAVEGSLLDAYRDASGDRDLDSRLLVYKLLVGSENFDSLPNDLPDVRTAAQRAAYANHLVHYESGLTTAVNRYQADRCLADFPPPVDGDIWAVDLDDTLETSRLGFPATSPAGAIALRRLGQHGQRVIISSGRSLAEVRQRCRAYRVAGGVAEYGSVIWDEGRQEIEALVDDRTVLVLRTLRQVLSAQPNVFVDPRYQYSLRLFSETREGRRGVPAQEVRQVIAACRLTGLQVIEGWRKTVVLAAGVDKGAGVTRLLTRLNARTAQLHAIGDAWPDLPVFRLAGACYAPGNAGPDLRRRQRELGLRIARRPYQSGVLELVEQALHGSYRHACARCSRPDLDPTAVTMMGLLGLQDLGRWGKLRVLLHRSVLRTFEL